jgi:hypothetical protein
MFDTVSSFPYIAGPDLPSVKCGFVEHFLPDERKQPVDWVADTQCHGARQNPPLVFVILYLTGAVPGKPLIRAFVFRGESLQTEHWPEESTMIK